MYCLQITSRIKLPNRILGLHRLSSQAFCRYKAEEIETMLNKKRKQDEVITSNRQKALRDTLNEIDEEYNTMEGQK